MHIPINQSQNGVFSAARGERFKDSFADIFRYAFPIIRNAQLQGYLMVDSRLNFNIAIRCGVLDRITYQVGIDHTETGG